MSNIRKSFTSRFGEEGVLIEADFSQLEVIALAFLSKDEQLYFDINNNIDVHSINAANLFGSSFTEKQRKLAKRLSFQLQYGAGAVSMALKNDIPVAKAKQFIETYYKRYPKVKEWQNKQIQIVEKSREISDKKTTNGIPAGKGTLRSLTSRKYVFYEQDAKDWQLDRGIYTSFNPTNIKNYPVQGFATGDIVPMCLGKLYREVKRRREWDGNVLLTNTVHDSVLLDVKKKYLLEAASVVKSTLENAPQYLKEEFGIDFDLPLKVDVSIGNNWQEMEKM